MSDRDLCFIPATELLRLYRTRKVSPLETMRAVFARIDAVNPTLNAYVTLARESALAGARKATAALGKKEAALPPLHGIPVSIKDLTVTKGLRTTWGSKIFADHVPTEDAITVERLKRAGAIVVGKTNTPEFGAGGNTFNAVFGATRNPWNPDLTCGGSSGGAAVALATGMGPLAQGSDTGGSLRIPAAFCGVVGFRTSPGLVPHHPRALAWDTISVTGPMARTVGDTALMLAVLAGPDDRAPLSYQVDTSAFLKAVKAPSVKGWRVAWTPDLAGLIPVDAEVARVAEGATRVFRSLGARVEAASPDFTEIGEIVLGTRGVSMVANFAKHLGRWKEHMQEGLVWNIEQGLALPRGDRARGDAARRPLAAPPRVHGDPRPADPADHRGAALPRGTALPDRNQWQAARQLHPVGVPDLRHHAHRPARDLRALRVHAEWPARRASDRGPPAAGSGGAEGGGGLRGCRPVGRQDSAERPGLDAVAAVRPCSVGWPAKRPSESPVNSWIPE